MNVFRIRKTSSKNVRDIVYDKRALKKAAKESIQDQKRVTERASKLRAQSAN